MEIKGVRATRKPAILPPHPAFAKIEEADFMEKQVLRSSLHEREGGTCFYCLRRITGDRRCLDHVVPQAQGGGNSYRNLVSC
jgi:5-methylcytosine-specific restriction endonuclease McrA